MFSLLKSAAKTSSGNRWLIRLKQVLFPGSVAYWEGRYASGGNSGSGSSGRIAEFKAEVIADFIKTQKVSSAIEFGCGDGYQLGLISYPQYTGLDVSAEAISRCREIYQADPSRRFMVYDPSRFDGESAGFKADLALSLDVIYHIVEDDIYRTYLKHLFDAAGRYVIIFSTDLDAAGGFYARHVKHRRFTRDVEKWFPDWKRVRIIKNKYPKKGIFSSGSLADFFIYETR